MENGTSLQKFKPIEITTHNLHFHEDSPVLSTDFYNGIVATCGFDNSVRLWMPQFSEKKYRDNVYKTAANSSISFEFFMEFNEFSKPINCVRFFQNCKKDLFKFILAACCDGGKVVVITENKSYVVCTDTSDDAYEFCWCEDKLFIGFSSGKIEAYQMHITTSDCDLKSSINNEDKFENNYNRITDTNLKEETSKVNSTESSNKDQVSAKLSFDLIFTQKIHLDTIQGLSFNKKYNLIASYSLDKTVKVHKIEASSLHLVSVFDQKIDNSRGLFKRLFFDDDLLYIFIKNSLLHVISYPFRPIHLHKKIGPLNSTPVKILKGNYKGIDLLYVCTKKSIYIFNQDELVCTVDNCCYMAITDAFAYNDTLFVSSLDGFLATIRLS